MSVENIRGKLCFRFKYHPGILDAIKTVPTRKWDEKDRVHYIGKYEVQTIIDIFKSFDYEVTVLPEAQSLYQDVFARRELLLNTQKGLQTIQAPVNLKLPLRPFQKVGHDYLVTAGKCLLCDEMGTGKTVQLISAFKSLKEAGQASKMMVLCPNSVKSSWQKDIAKFTDLKFSVVSGKPAERRACYESDYDILVLSYDSYLMDFGMTERNKDENGVVKRQPMPPPQVQVLVADECQRLVRTKNKITQSLLILKEKLQLKYIYLVTGTPIVNRVEDIWSLLNFIDPEIVGEFWQFRNRYCIIEVEEIKMLDPKKKKQGIFEKVIRKIPKVVGYKNLNELKSKLSPMYIRREKKEVLPDLPDKIYETMDIDLSKDQRELYNFIQEDFHNRFKGEDVNVANALVWFIRAKQACDTSELIDPGMTSSSKMEELKELLEDLIDRGTHKVVLFSQYKQMTDIIVREFDKYNPLYLHGQTESKDRPLLIDAFQEDPKYRLFVSTLGAGGVGITLTAADIVILYDKWFSPAMNNQAIDRCHRIGQKNAVTVIDFICRNTIEERIEEILRNKRAMFEGLFGEDETMLSRLSSSELKQLI